MEEIRCDISDYKGLYQVSTLGRVRSLDRIIYDQGRHWFQNGKILKASSQKSGYLFVTLSKAGKAKQYRVHRLVAQAFIPNPNCCRGKAKQVKGYIYKYLKEHKNE